MKVPALHSPGPGAVSSLMFPSLTPRTNIQMPKTDAIKVGLVDDQLLVRSGFRMLINSHGDGEVMVGAGNGREALAAPLMAQADVILMDVRMPEMDGIEATERLLDPDRKAADGPKIIVLTT